MLKNKKTYFIPIIGFALIIIIGSIFLYSPLCNKGGISYKDCLFIATSGLTTTGIVKGPLIIQFNFIGQIILAVLMEIGAMGFIIFVSYFWSMKHKKMKMSDIMVINDSISGDDYSNITKHSLFIGRYMARVQIIGVILLSIVFVPIYGINGIWYSIFHTISAFSNTGFDLFGSQSMIIFNNNVYVQIITIALMIMGSLGILVIEDLKEKKFNFSKLKLQTKIVLVYTLVLLVLPMFLMKILDSDMSILNLLFMSASARSTGFSIVDLSSVSFETKSILAVLMFIGGGPTSTSGGIRILTFAILIATIFSTLRGKNETIIAWKKISEVTVRRAITIFTVFALVIIIATFAFIRINEKYVNVGDIIFDNISAISNTGLSLINYEDISIGGDIILMIVMFIGRAGPLTMLLAFVNDNPKDKYIQYPIENIVL